jgi:hypothetical protein
MADDLDLEEGEELENDEIRVRCTTAMKKLVEGMAAAETRARALRNRKGKISVNRLMKSVIEKYGASWTAEHKMKPPKSADDKEAVESAARAINVVRAAKQKKGRAEH